MARCRGAVLWLCCAVQCSYADAKCNGAHTHLRGIHSQRIQPHRLVHADHRRVAGAEVTGDLAGLRAHHSAPLSTRTPALHRGTASADMEG